MFKAPKGTKDLFGSDYDIIQDLTECIKREFVSAGGEPLETPVFERTDVLLGKYGEEADTKLIYNLANEGGELLALRYDLTVPFTRYIKENGIKQMRRYSIGKVYRRDQPNIKSGRYREFIQADFDIYGEKQEGMLAEATVLNTVVRALKSYNLTFTILINDIRNLQYLLNTKLDIENWRPLCPIIDKLDKQSFESLKPEFTALGLSSEKQNELETLLLSSEPILEQTQNDYKTLMELADVLDFKNNIVFANSLARGLDYYTGFVWEFKLDGIGSSISAGGRYDDLLGAPTVGISLGISRLASYLTPKKPEWNDKCYVTAVGNVALIDKLRIIKKLQDTMPMPIIYSLSLDSKKLNKVITTCCSSYTRYVAIVAESELKDNKFILKDLKNETQTFINI
jgi:histidyl-tRNA synthetase